MTHSENRFTMPLHLHVIVTLLTDSRFHKELLSTSSQISQSQESSKLCTIYTVHLHSSPHLPSAFYLYSHKLCHEPSLGNECIYIVVIESVVYVEQYYRHSWTSLHAIKYSYKIFIKSVISLSFAAFRPYFDWKCI